MKSIKPSNNVKFKLQLFNIKYLSLFHILQIIVVIYDFGHAVYS